MLFIHLRYLSEISMKIFSLIINTTPENRRFLSTSLYFFFVESKVSWYDDESLFTYQIFKILRSQQQNSFTVACIFRIFFSFTYPNCLYFSSSSSWILRKKQKKKIASKYLNWQRILTARARSRRLFLALSRPRNDKNNKQYTNELNVYNI